MTALLIISFVVFAIYNLAIVLNYGIPWSVSNTYYTLEDKHKSWIFTFMCWISGGLLLPVMLEYSPENYQFLAFLACGAMIFVGAAPQFRISLTGVVHYVSAVICCIASLLWIALCKWWILLAWILVLGYAIYKICKKTKSGVSLIESVKELSPVYWFEIISALLTYITTLILMI